MPYRLRLFSGDRLLLATDHETTEEAGRALGEFPVDEVIEGEAGARGAEIRWQTTHHSAGGERPASPEEEEEIFDAMVKRHAEVTLEQLPPCRRCGAEAIDHEYRYPLLCTPEGPVYYACWTPEDRDRLLPPGWPRQ